MSIEVFARHDRVILKAIEFQEGMVGGIAISDNGKEKADRYTIVAIGPGFTNPNTGMFTPTQYQVGDEVLVHKALVHNVKVDGEDFFITRDLEILGYIVNTENDQPTA